MLHKVFVIIFVSILYHGVRLVVKSKEEFYSDRTHAKQQQQQQQQRR